MTPPLALAVSPHLDDAVFSAGGRLADLAREGWRVVVATVFTASVPDPRGFALACQLDKGVPADIDYMALRRAEDAEACRLLGAEPRWLPFAEAPHRGYHDPRALFAGLRADDPVVAAITPALAGLVAELEPDLVLGPQAVGGHVDHCAVVDALARLSRSETWWWRDYPYLARSGIVAEPFAARFAALDVTTVPPKLPSRAARTEAALAYKSQLGFQFGGADAARACFSALDREEFCVSPGSQPTGGDRGDA